MLSSNNLFCKVLSDQFWELKLLPEVYTSFFEELKHLQIKIISSEIACSIQLKSSQIILENSIISFPETGLNIDFNQVGICILKMKSTKKSLVNLVFTSLKRDEQIVIEFQLLNKSSLEALSSILYKIHDDLPSSGRLQTKRLTICPKCKIKRENTRSDISSSFLYHVISFACFLDQEIWISFGKGLISFTKSFPPKKEFYREGIISLINSDCVIALDISEVFHSIAQTSFFEGKDSTLVNCYNSHGLTLFNLIQQNTELYEMWNLSHKKEHCD